MFCNCKQILIEIYYTYAFCMCNKYLHMFGIINIGVNLIINYNNISSFVRITIYAYISYLIRIHTLIYDRYMYKYNIYTYTATFSSLSHPHTSSPIVPITARYIAYTLYYPFSPYYFDSPYSRQFPLNLGLIYP